MSASNQRFALKSKRVVTPAGIESACVVVSNGLIEDVVAPDAQPAGIPVEDLGNLVVMAGLVDSHVHVNEPGRTHWEGFETATKAAAAGGITTLADMPLNCIPVTTSLSAFKEKLAAIDGLLFIDCAFWGGVVPGNEGELESMIDAGVAGFKCFLIHSGIDEFPNVTDADLSKAMPVLARRAVPLLVHAELEHGEADEKSVKGDPRDYDSYLKSRPDRWEQKAIQMMVDLAKKHGGKVHIVHLSSAEAVDTIAAARHSGLAFSVETCPHYLTLCAEDVPEGDTRYKCAPPIRQRENSARLWKALEAGTIDFVVSDHSPCTPELKLLAEGNFHKAWGGISSVQFGLPVVWTEAKKRGHSPADIARWMCEKTADFLGLRGKKGRLVKGADADIVVWDPEAPFAIKPETTHHKHKLTPHDHKSLSGVVKQTYLRGIKIYDEGAFPAGPVGKPLLRNANGESR